MSTDSPPNLHLSVPIPTQSFKRSFQQFGLDVDADGPEGSMNDGASGSASSWSAGGSTRDVMGGGGGSNARNGVGREPNAERNKRARSEGPSGVEAGVGSESGGVDTGSGSFSLFTVGSSSSRTHESVMRSPHSATESSSSFVLPSPWETTRNAAPSNSVLMSTTTASQSIGPVSIGPILGSGVSASGLSLGHVSPILPQNQSPAAGSRSSEDSEIMRSLEPYSEFEQNIAPLRQSPVPNTIAQRSNQASSSWSSRAASGVSGNNSTGASARDAPARVTRDSSMGRRGRGWLSFMSSARPASPTSEQEEDDVDAPSSSGISDLSIDIDALMQHVRSRANRAVAGPPLPTGNSPSIGLMPQRHSTLRDPSGADRGSRDSWGDAYPDVLLRQLERAHSRYSAEEEDRGRAAHMGPTTGNDPSRSFAHNASDTSRLGRSPSLREPGQEDASRRNMLGNRGNYLPSVQDLYADVLRNAQGRSVRAHGPSLYGDVEIPEWRLWRDLHDNANRPIGEPSRFVRADNANADREASRVTPFAEPADADTLSMFGLSPSRDSVSTGREESIRGSFLSGSLPSSGRFNLPTLRSAVEQEEMRSNRDNSISSRFGPLDQINGSILLERQGTSRVQRRTDRLDFFDNSPNQNSREEYTRINPLEAAADRRGFSITRRSTNLFSRDSVASHNPPSARQSGEPTIEDPRGRLQHLLSMTSSEHRSLPPLSEANWTREETGRGGVDTRSELPSSRQLPRLPGFAFLSTAAADSRRESRLSMPNSMSSNLTSVLSDLEERLERERSLPITPPIGSTNLLDESSTFSTHSAQTSSEAAAFFASEIGQTRWSAPEASTTQAQARPSVSTAAIRQRVRLIAESNRNRTSSPRLQPRSLSPLRRHAGNTPYAGSIPLADGQEDDSDLRLSSFDGNASLDNLEQWMRQPSFAPFSQPPAGMGLLEHSSVGDGVSAHAPGRAMRNLETGPRLSLDAEVEALWDVPSRAPPSESVSGRWMEHDNTNRDVPRVGERRQVLRPPASWRNAIAVSAASREEPIPPPPQVQNREVHMRNRELSHLREFVAANVQRGRRRLERLELELERHSANGRRFRPSATSSVNGQGDRESVVSRDFDQAMNVLQADGMTEPTQRRLREAHAQDRNRSVWGGRDGRDSWGEEPTTTTTTTGFYSEQNRRRNEEARTLMRRRDRESERWTAAPISSDSFFPLDRNAAANQPSEVLMSHRSRPVAVAGGDTNSERTAPLQPTERSVGARRRSRLARLHQTGDRNSFSIASLFGGRIGPGRRNPGDFMRDEDFDSSYEGLLALAATLGEAKSRATPAEVIAALPNAMYKEWKTPESDLRCPICLDDYQPNDPVLKAMPCTHWCHKECLEQWLHSARTCPVCRTKINKSRRSNGNAAASSSAAASGSSGFASSSSAPVAGSSRQPIVDDVDSDEDSDTPLHLNPYTFL